MMISGTLMGALSISSHSRCAAGVSGEFIRRVVILTFPRKRALILQATWASLGQKHPCVAE
jgi:hypothetical protein